MADSKVTTDIAMLILVLLNWLNKQGALWGLWWTRHGILDCALRWYGASAHYIEQKPIENSAALALLDIFRKLKWARSCVP